MTNNDAIIEIERVKAILGFLSDLLLMENDNNHPLSACLFILKERLEQLIKRIDIC